MDGEPQGGFPNSLHPFSWVIARVRPRNFATLGAVVGAGAFGVLSSRKVMIRSVNLREAMPLAF